MSDPKEPTKRFQAAVKDGQLVYTSVSQIKKFDAREEGGCERRWYFRYVKRLPEPQTGAQAAGEQVHAQLEHYLKTGEDVLGDIARAGKHLLPEPGPDLMIEAAIDGGLDAAGVPLIGKIDVVVPPSRGQLEVIDHKSTSNLKYAKTSKQLATDTQMIGYGEWARRKFGGEDVQLTHIYYQTRGQLRAQRSTTLVALKTVKSQWQSVESIVERMKKVALEPAHESVQANEKSCFSYGKPCPYRTQCSDLNPLTRLSTMSLLNKIKSPPPAAQTINGAEYSEQQQALLKVDAQGNPVKRLIIEDRMAESDTLTASVLPPDAPKSDPELAAECEPCADTGKGGQQHKASDCPVVNPPVEAAPKKGRGRPKKNAETVTASPKEADAGHPSPVNTVAASPTGVASSPAGVKASVAPPEVAQGSTSSTVVDLPWGGFDLYVDCIPSTPFTRLDHYVAELHTEVIVKGANVPDMALLDFGKGKGFLRAAAAAKPPTGICVIFSSDMSAPVIDGLIPLARFVVRGVR